MKRPHILIIYTGGTIGMIENAETHALQPFDFSHLMENVPKVRMLDYEIDNYQFEPPIDSSDMDFDHWRRMARIIEERYDDYDGFVILHGTDTMSYTSSALSFMLEGLSKPVIITGSQLPIGEVRTDGEENLITALMIAAARRPDGRPMVQEVAILFENYLWRGCRATKCSADNFNAFMSHNYPALAHIGLGIQYDRKALEHRDETHPLRVHYGLDNNVLVVTLYPGLDERTFRHLLSTPGLKGVVMRTFGAGNCPTSGWFVDAVTDALARGIVIYNVTQCASGSVNPGRYVSAELLTRKGVVPGFDITYEAAVTKMMHLFGRGYDADQVRRLMSKPLAGEMTVD